MLTPLKPVWDLSCVVLQTWCVYPTQHPIPPISANLPLTGKYWVHSISLPHQNMPLRAAQAHGAILVLIHTPSILPRARRPFLVHWVQPGPRPLPGPCHSATRVVSCSLSSNTWDINTVYRTLLNVSSAGKVFPQQKHGCFQEQ